MANERPRKVLIIGAGPVGSLTALSLDKRGWDVEVWDGRDDPRETGAVGFLRSINLNISSRGLSALQSVDPSLADIFLSESIPMRSRMIHHVDGRLEPQLYDPIRGQCSNSISRPMLNLRFIETLPPTVTLCFNKKLSRVDFKNKKAYGISGKAGVKPGEEHDDGKIGGGASTKGKEQAEDECGFDLIIGADGSWSKVRSEMMRVERIDFSQSFIPHAYIELYMPPDPTKPGNFAMDPNHLHIWPRHAFMLIALPNKDGSFTLTLFLPFSALEEIHGRQGAINFFRENFPSAVEIVGEKALVDQFESNPRGNLVTINASPSSWSSNAMLLGDAWHSMVPFYGQGLNCGLEDVRVFNSYLENHKIKPTTTALLGSVDPELEKALHEFSYDRDADLRAICELALNNYTEMRSSVLSPLHKLRRYLDSILMKVFRSTATAELSLTNPFPTKRVKGWTSLYEMVTFRPDIGYAEALRRERWQKEVVWWSSYVLGGSVLGVVGLGTHRLLRRLG